MPLPEDAARPLVGEARQRLEVVDPAGPRPSSCVEVKPRKSCARVGDAGRRPGSRRRSASSFVRLRRAAEGPADEAAPDARHAQAPSRACDDRARAVGGRAAESLLEGGSRDGCPRARSRPGRSGSARRRAPRATGRPSPTGRPQVARQIVRNRRPSRSRGTWSRKYGRPHASVMPRPGGGRRVPALEGTERRVQLPRAPRAAAGGRGRGAARSRPRGGAAARPRATPSSTTMRTPRSRCCSAGNRVAATAARAGAAARASSPAYTPAAAMAVRAPSCRSSVRVRVRAMPDPSPAGGKPPLRARTPRRAGRLRRPEQVAGDGGTGVHAGAHLRRPERRARPRRRARTRVPSNVAVKTTSFATVAQEKTGSGSRRSHRTSPLDVERHDATRARERVDGVELLVALDARLHAEVDDRDEETAVGMGHRRLDAAEEAGAHASGRSGSGPSSFTCRPTFRSHSRSPRIPVPRDHATGLPGAEDDVAPVHPGEDGRRLEVVVADVVRRHLVVPEQPPVARRARPARSV